MLDVVVAVETPGVQGLDLIGEVETGRGSRARIGAARHRPRRRIPPAAAGDHRSPRTATAEAASPDRPTRGSGPQPSSRRSPPGLPRRPTACCSPSTRARRLDGTPRPARLRPHGHPREIVAEPDGASKCSPQRAAPAAYDVPTPAFTDLGHCGRGPGPRGHRAAGRGPGGGRAASTPRPSTGPMLLDPDAVTSCSSTPQRQQARPPSSTRPLRRGPMISGTGSRGTARPARRIEAGALSRHREGGARWRARPPRSTPPDRGRASTGRAVDEDEHLAEFSLPQRHPGRGPGLLSGDTSDVTRRRRSAARARSSHGLPGTSANPALHDEVPMADGSRSRTPNRGKSTPKFRAEGRQFRCGRGWVHRDAAHRLRVMEETAAAALRHQAGGRPGDRPAGRPPLLGPQHAAMRAILGRPPRCRPPISSRDLATHAQALRAVTPGGPRNYPAVRRPFNGISAQSRSSTWSG